MRFLITHGEVAMRFSITHGSGNVPPGVPSPPRAAFAWVRGPGKTRQRAGKKHPPLPTPAGRRRDNPSRHSGVTIVYTLVNNLLLSGGKLGLSPIVRTMVPGV
jgi:hypothetical protein